MNINQNKKENDLIAEAYKQVTAEQRVPLPPAPVSDGSEIAAHLRSFGDDENEWTDQQKLEAREIKKLHFKRGTEGSQTDAELISMAQQSATAMAKDRDTPSLGGGGMMGRHAVNTPDNSAPNVALNARGLSRPDMEPPPALGNVTTPPPPTEPTSGAFDTATKWVADNKPLAAGLGGAGAALLAAKLLKKKKKDKDDE